MIKVGIYGYGNLGKGIECALSKCEDMSLYGIFTRRDPSTLTTLTGASVYSADDVLSHVDDIDVLVICGGSATDLPTMTPKLAKHFNVVDSYDTHATIPSHYANVDKSAREGSKVALISAGWDPGMFSLARLYGSAILPNGDDYTFWGKGVSQGHSDAIRRIDGVVDARQYTIPIESALDRVRSGEHPTLTPREKHLRECYVVVADGVDKDRVEHDIKIMPNYFADYDTTVHFVSQEALDRDHKGIPHGGFVIRSGRTGLGDEHAHVVEYSLKLDSNPEFTASVITSFARAVAKMSERGEVGAKTVFDIRPIDLSPLDREEIISKML